MKLYTPSGIAMDIERNATGGFDINCVSAPKDYYSKEDGLRDRENNMAEILRTLRQKGIIGGGNSGVQSAWSMLGNNISDLENENGFLGNNTGLGQDDKERHRRFIYEPEEDEVGALPEIPQQKADNKKIQKPAASITRSKTVKTTSGKIKKKETVSKKTKPVVQPTTNAEIQSYLDKANASSTGFSNEYLIQLVNLEGITLKMYDDDGSASGNTTIGIGNMIHTGIIGNTEANKKLEEPYKNGITIDKAFTDFVSKVNQMRAELKNMLKHAGIKADEDLFGVFFDVYWNGEDIAAASAFYKDAGVQGLLAGLKEEAIYWNTPTKKDPKHKTQINRRIKSPSPTRKNIKVNELEKRADLYDKAGDIENLKINKNDEDAKAIT